jgi:hypothetical protein
MAQVVDAFGDEIYNAKKNIIQNRITGATTPVTAPTKTAEQIWKDTGFAQLEEGMKNTPKTEVVANNPVAPQTTIQQPTVDLKAQAAAALQASLDKYVSDMKTMGAEYAMR